MDKTVSNSGANDKAQGIIRSRVYEALHVPIVVMDAATWRYVDCNAAAVQMYRFSSREEMLGKTPFDVSAPTQYDGTPSRDKARQYIEKALAGESVVFEWRHQRPDGEPWDAEVHLVSFHSGGGQYLQFTLQDITERKRAEMELRETQRQLSTLMDNLPGMAYRCANTPEWPMIFVSEGCAALTGYSAADIMRNMPAYGKLIVPEHAQGVLNQVQAALEHHEPYELIYQITNAHKERRWMWERGRGVLDETGRLLFLEGFITDITGRKQAEATLQASEERYRALFDLSPDGIVIVDPETAKILSFNETAHEQLGYTREEFACLSIADLEVLETREQTQARIQDILNRKRADFETQQRTKKGEIRDVHVTAQVIPVSGRNIYHCIWRDITEHKRAEAAQARLATVVEQAAEAIVITDLQGTIEYVNPAFERNSGYTQAEVLGQNPRILKSGKHDATFYRQMWTDLVAGRVWHGRIINRRKDGRFYEEETTISPVRDASGKVVNYVGVKYDVTREVQLESQLRQSQKLEAVGQLAGGVAHDINNILAAMMMNVDLLQQNEELDSDTRAGLRELETGAKRAASLTRQLLMFSRRSVMETKVLDLNEVVDNLLKMLRRLLGEQITLAFERASTLPMVEADAGMLDQMLMNLAVNARDAMPRGGRIRITTSQQELTEEQAAGLPARRPGRFVCITVADTGCGMDEGTILRIFEPFFTTKEMGKGTGLGLATVHGIVAQHKGWVEVESQVGQGSTFRVYLPAVQTVAEVAKPEEARVLAKGHETILLVEDDPSVRKVLSQTLRALGYGVLQASNGQEAMTLWKAHGPEIALLLTDMIMPEGMTGLELARRIQETRPGVKVIISSGYSSEITKSESITAAGFTYLSKPYQIRLLGDTIRQCLDRP